MPILTPGMTTLGPAGGSSITTLPAYLASIGKNSFYARFVAGTNMYVNADKTGGSPTLDSGTVGSWDYDAANTSNWSAYWSQSNAADRPRYMTAGGVASIAGNADSHHIDLNSTTALNGTYSVLIKYTLLARDSRALFSHNVTACHISSSAGSAQLFSIAANGASVADQIIQVSRNSPGTSSGKGIVGVTQNGTGHNGTAPRLFRRSSTYSNSAISEIWFMPALNAEELDDAMTFIA